MGFIDAASERRRADASGLRYTIIAALVLAGITLAAGTVLAAPDEDPQAVPVPPPMVEPAAPAVPRAEAPAQGAETAAPARLRLEFPARTVAVNLLASAREAVIARPVPFDQGRHTLTADARRALGALHSSMEAAAPRNTPFAILVAGQDEVLAFRRAKALREELIARYRLSPERLIATAGARQTDESRPRVEVIALDPARCGDCGQTSLRAVALDSGGSRIVRATGEQPSAGNVAGAPAPAAPAPAPEKPGAATPKPAKPPVRAASPAPGPVATVPPAAEVVTAPLPPARPARQARVAAEPAPEAVAAPVKRADRLDRGQETREEIRAERRAERRELRRARLAASEASPPAYPRRGQGGCPRPRIIIDDYWPGGPLVPCSGHYRRGW